MHSCSKNKILENYRKGKNIQKPVGRFGEKKIKKIMLSYAWTWLYSTLQCIVLVILHILNVHFSNSIFSLRFAYPQNTFFSLIYLNALIMYVMQVFSPLILLPCITARYPIHTTTIVECHAEGPLQWLMS